MKLLLAIAVALVPATAAAQAQYALFALNLRAAPADTAAVVEAVPAGDVLTVERCGLGEGGAWCSATHGANAGYAKADFLTSGGAVATTGRSAPRSGSRAGARTSAGSSRRRTGPQVSRAAAAGYFTGPQGGCYTYSASGRKRYVDHSYCGR